MITVLLAAILRVIRRETFYAAARHFEPPVLWPVGTPEQKPGTYADFVNTVLGRHARGCWCVPVCEFKEKERLLLRYEVALLQRPEPSVKLRRPARRRLGRGLSWRSTAYAQPGEGVWAQIWQTSSALVGTIHRAQQRWRPRSLVRPSKAS